MRDSSFGTRRLCENQNTGVGSLDSYKYSHLGQENIDQAPIILSGEQEILQLLDQFNDDTFDNNFQDSVNRNNVEKNQDQIFLPNLGLQFYPPSPEEQGKDSSSNKQSTDSNKTSTQDFKSFTDIQSQQNKVTGNKQGYENTVDIKQYEDFDDFDNDDEYYNKEVDDLLMGDSKKSRKYKEKNFLKDSNTKGLSHSHVEKLRRDRINSLIDELRFLVPTYERDADGKEDCRRAKHIILQDTVALVKGLYAKGFTKKDLLTYLPENSQYSEIKEQEDVQVKEMVDEDIDIKIQSFGDQSYIIQVTCKDRKGLLSDIIDGLRQQPLEIRQAVVVTTREGQIEDSFEVVLDETSLLGGQDLKSCVLHAIQGNRSSQSFGKKTKRQRRPG